MELYTVREVQQKVAAILSQAMPNWQQLSAFRKTPAPGLKAQANTDLARRGWHGVWTYPGFLLALAVTTAYPREHPAAFESMSAIASLLSLARLWLGLQCGSIPSSGHSAWRTRWRAIVLATALLWGLFFAQTFLYYGFGDWISVLCMLFGLGACTAALVALTPDLPLLLAYVALLVGPQSLYCIYVHDGRASGYFLLIVLYCIFLFAQASELHRQYWDYQRGHTLLQVRASELESAVKLVESASKAKDEFLANISHEIRTPLNGILGMANLLHETRLTNEQQTYLTAIQDSSQVLLQIINDLLDVAKVEAGKMTLNPVIYELREMVEDIVTLMGPLANTKGLSLVLRSAPGTPDQFYGDPMRLRQVITNLVGNAIKFTSQGHVLVTLQRDAEAGQLVVEVEDTGIGIPPEHMERIFEDFTQVDNSTTRRFGGTGLGLAICRRLVELMQGRISAESTEGKGSRFTLRLPLGPASEKSTAVDLSHLHVACIGGDEVSTIVLREQLDQWKVRGDSLGPLVAGGFSHPQGELNDPFDAVILEANADSDEVRRLGAVLREDPNLINLPALLVLRAGQHLDETVWRVAGFDDCIQQPLRVSPLLKFLESAKPPVPAPTTMPIAGNQLFPCRILVAEDNVINQRVAFLLLRKFGCEVDLAANGREAVLLAAEISYDAVLMDCQMPEMDGYEATAAIRKKGGRLRRLPIIAMTAGAADREHCLRNGMSDYVAKPVQPDELYATLRRWTKSRTAPVEETP